MADTKGKKQSRAETEEARLALSRTQRALSSLPAKKRMDAIIDSPESAKLVRAMPVQELYSTIVEVGLADSSELVQMATPAQFQGFIDLSAWQKHRMEPRAILTWLRAARGDDETGFLEKLRKMDLELLELVLRHYVRVHDLEENPDVQTLGVPLETPEGRYLIEMLADGIELAALRQLITDLIAENPFEAVRLFEAIRWELPSELEHVAHQFRAARLEDLGFPPADAAHSIFSYLKPPQVQVSPDAAARGLSLRQRVDYFQAAMAALNENEREHVGEELRSLANSALIAESAEPGDLDAVRRIAEMVSDTLSLGLEHLTGGVPELAAETVRDQELRRIFQVGFSLTLQLKFRADRLARRPGARRQGRWFLLAEQAAALEALRAVRPRRALRVEGAEPVPFRSRAELLDSEAILARAEAQQEILAALLGEEPEKALAALELPEEQLEAEVIFTAVVAHALLEGSPKIAAVPRERVRELGALWVEASGDEVRVRAEARARVNEVLAAVVPAGAQEELGRVVDTTLQRVAQELGRSLLEVTDPRTVSAVFPLSGR